MRVVEVTRKIQIVIGVRNIICVTSGTRMSSGVNVKISAGQDSDCQRSETGSVSIDEVGSATLNTTRSATGSSEPDKRKADVVVALKPKRLRSMCNSKLTIDRSLSNSLSPRLIRPSERPGYGDERFNETTYYFENGLRKVHPYYFTFTTYCKGRWINRKLLEVFAQEFRAQPISEFERCIKLGQITVNSERVPLDYVLQDGDLVANKSHRHEIPVSDVAIKIVHRSDDLLVIDKPSSIPVHPCGRYRHNSVIFILGKEHGFRQIRTIHRIDRLTSGLLMLGLSTEKARVLETQISTRLVQKEYLCLVDGQFPSEAVTCNEPITVLSYKIGICCVSSEGKDCRTEFERLSTNGKTSIVLCKPHTGRMHQIRVHLQYLGYPIVNDPIYNHSVFGPVRGKNGDFGKSHQQLIEDLLKTHTTEAWLGGENRDAATDLGGLLPPTIVVSESALPENTPNTTAVKDNEEEEANKTVAGRYDPHCADCNRRVVFRDPTPSDLIMYLHCWKYRGPDWHFETKIPFWAEGKLK